MIQTKYLIIGGSAAGISACNTLARLDPEASMLCVTGQIEQPYNKCFLVDWLAGSTSRSELDLKVSFSVRFLNHKVVSLDSKAKIANLDNGLQISYEKALIAIGVQSFLPPIAGLNSTSQVFSFHGLQDIEKIQEFIQKNTPKNAVVIGAGLTGVECADALWRLGLQVTLVERSNFILGKLIDQSGAQALENWILDSGVQIYKNATVCKINQEEITLDSGVILPADLIILAAGVRPNKLEMIGDQLLYVDSHVQVDQFMQTNLSNIWAAGDMIVVPDLLTGRLIPSCSWPDAMLQGNLAAQNMVGKIKPFAGLLQIANSHFFNKKFISLGNLDGHDYDLTQTASSYQKKVFNNQKKAQGALLIGDITSYLDIKRTILTNI